MLTIRDGEESKNVKRLSVTCLWAVSCFVQQFLHLSLPGLPVKSLPESDREEVLSPSCLCSPSDLISL